MARHPTPRRGGGVTGAVCAAAAVALVLALVPLTASAAAAAVDPVPTTLDPIGGGYTDPSLVSFAANVAANATPPTVDILVIPAAFGSKPSIRSNLARAKLRTDQIRHDCSLAVESTGWTCVVGLVRIFRRSDARRPQVVARLEDQELDGMYFLGGNPVWAMRILARTPAEDAMAAAYARGVLVGGNSAGEEVESATMIAGYNPGFESPTALEERAPDIWWSDDQSGRHRGLSFGSKAAVFDAHFYEEGRLPRLLNVTAQSQDHFGGAGLLGVGFDFGTGALVQDDRTMSGMFGWSSTAIVDLATAGSTHTWNGANKTLSERDALTDIVAPGNTVSFDMSSRIATVDGQPVPFVSPGPWPNGVLSAPGSGTLMLGGDLTGAPPGLATTGAITRFAQLAAASGGNRIVVLAAAYADEASAADDAARYATSLRAAGWAGELDVVLYPDDPLPSLDGVAGVLLAGGDPSLLQAALDPDLRGFVADSIQTAPVVLTDQAMTQAMGGAYAANPNVEPFPIADAPGTHWFRAGVAQVVPGLGYLPGAMFVPRLGEDERWGQLYGLTIAQPALLAFGIDEDTAIELPPGGHPVVVGGLSVVTADGRTATDMVGSNHAFTDLNVLVDAFAPGDTVAG